MALVNHDTGRAVLEAVLCELRVSATEFAPMWANEIRKIAAGEKPPVPPDGVKVITAALAHKLREDV